MRIKTEPVAVAGGGAGAFMLIVPYLVSIAVPNVPLPVQGAISVLVAGPLIGVFVAVARRFSFPEETLREAGLDPAAVRRNAADPAVKRCTKAKAAAPGGRLQRPTPTPRAMTATARR